MPTGKVSITEGSGKNAATHSINEDAVTKELQRVVLNKSNGAELDYGAGNVSGNTPRFTLATDGIASTLLTAIRTAVETLAGWALNAGATTAATLRVVLSNDSPGISQLNTLANLDKGAGNTSANTLRAVLAADGPTNTSLAAIKTASEIIAAWDKGTGNVSSNTQRVTLAADGPANQNLGRMAKPVQGEYKAVAASQTNSQLGVTGAVGDFLTQILVVPATTSPGAVTINDGTNTMTVFVGGTNSVSNLVPFPVTLMMSAPAASGWRLTTGANVSVIAIGDFT